MKIGAGDRNKMIAACSLGAVALGAVIYNFAGGSSDSPASTPPPPPVVAVPGHSTPNPAARVSRSSSDPTLHPEGMELTEQLLYTGNGRNIFVANSEPPVVAPPPKPIVGPRTTTTAAPVYTGPPPLPPIDLRFFGTATKANGTRQAFFLKGDDVFLAVQGDVVSRRYKVGAIGANSVEVTDLTNNNTQRLPLAPQ